MTVGGGLRRCMQGGGVFALPQSSYPKPVSLGLGRAPELRSLDLGLGHHSGGASPLPFGLVQECLKRIVLPVVRS